MNNATSLLSTRIHSSLEQLDSLLAEMCPYSPSSPDYCLYYENILLASVERASLFSPSLPLSLDACFYLYLHQPIDKIVKQTTSSLQSEKQLVEQRLVELKVKCCAFNICFACHVRICYFVHMQIRKALVPRGRRFWSVPMPTQSQNGTQMVQQKAVAQLRWCLFGILLSN